MCIFAYSVHTALHSLSFAIAFISAQASVQTKRVTTPKHNVDPTALAEVEGIIENPGVLHH